MFAPRSGLRNPYLLIKYPMQAARHHCHQLQPLGLPSIRPTEFGMNFGMANQALLAPVLVVH